MAWDPYKSLAQFGDNGAQTTFDSLGGLGDLARQLGWTGQWNNGVFDPTATLDPMEWLKSQGYDLMRQDGMTGPNGRQASNVGAMRDGQMVGQATNEARPEQSIGGMFGDVLTQGVLPAAAMYFGGRGLESLLGGGAAAGGASAAGGSMLPSTQSIGLLGAGSPEMAIAGLTDVPSIGFGAAGTAALPTISAGPRTPPVGGLGNLAGQLLGGAIGAATSRGGETTTTSTSERAPWEPAQQWLKDLIGQGQQLQQQYTQQPFSSTQQQALGNVFGLANSANQAAGGLMSQMGALGRGYDRTSPNRTQTGYQPQQFDLSSLLKMIPNFGG